jgi:hypothetical protein
MIVDNVGSHKIKEVREAYDKAGWMVQYLPKNMTAELQPMDIVVNSRVKAKLRKLRIDNIY